MRGWGALARWAPFFDDGGNSPSPWNGAPNGTFVAQAIKHTTTLLPSGGDDTPQITSAISTLATAALADGTNIIEVVFGASAVYSIQGALVQGGSGKTNAQIPLPFIALNSPKLVIVFRGPKNMAATEPATQTSVESSGAVLLSTLTGQAYSGTYGKPCVVGGPDIVQAGSGFTNVSVIFDNVHVRVPDNPTIAGLNLEQVEQFEFTDLRCDTNVADASITQATHPQAIAVIMPGTGNNAIARGGNLQVQGYYGAIAPGEHTNIGQLTAWHCIASIAPIASINHAVHFGMADIEQCPYVYSAVDVSGAGIANGWGSWFPMVIDLLDIEDAGAGIWQPVAHINDPTNIAKIKANFWRWGSLADLIVSGAQNCLLTNINQAAADPKIGLTIPIETTVLPAPAVGTWSWENPASGGNPWATIFNSSNAQNDAGTWTFYADAGTYDLDVLGLAESSAAIWTVAIDGTTVATFDFYNATTVGKHLAHSAIAISGLPGAKHTIKVTAATRNASSGGWLLEIARLLLTRRS